MWGWRALWAARYGVRGPAVLPGWCRAACHAAAVPLCCAMPAPACSISCRPAALPRPQIEYIFSDKTGTLTSNEMQLREIAVKGVAYGTSELRLEEHPERTGLAALRLFDQRLYKAAAKVQRSSSWSGLITAGGSRRDMMAHPTSYPNLDSQGSLGIADEAEPSQQDSGPASDPSTGGRLRRGGAGWSRAQARAQVSRESAYHHHCCCSVHALRLHAGLPPGWAGPDSPLHPPLCRSPAGQRNDWEEGSTALGHHLIDFWTNVCLCQSLIIEKNPEGPDTLPHVYQACGRGWAGPCDGLRSDGRCGCCCLPAGPRNCACGCCGACAVAALELTSRHLIPSLPSLLSRPCRAPPPTRWLWLMRRGRWALSSRSAPRWAGGPGCALTQRRVGQSQLRRRRRGCQQLSRCAWPPLPAERHHAQHAGPGGDVRGAQRHGIHIRQVHRWRRLLLPGRQQAAAGRAAAAAVCGAAGLVVCCLLLSVNPAIPPAAPPPLPLLPMAGAA